VNRSPCDGVVREIRYRKGKFLDARHSDCGECNESNTVVLDTAQGTVVVRQVAGMIARRIICPLQIGDHVRMGQRIGLIKFGSRTELIVAQDRFEPAVQVGDNVAGASTIIMRQRNVAPPERDTRNSKLETSV
jgi:phosphatidylserine decarboxylase